MSAKISALPAAGNALEADLLTIVQAGVNKKTDRATLLAADPTETVELSGGGSLVQVEGNGNVNIVAFAGTFLTIQGTGGAMITIDAVGAVNIIGAGTSDMIIQNSTTRIRFIAGGGMLISDLGAQVVDVQYFAGNPLNWAGAVPIDLRTAIDRVANEVVVLSGAPVP